MNKHSALCVLIFLFYSATTYAIDVDTLRKDTENSFFFQNDESVSKLYLYDNYLYYFDISMNGFCKVRGGWYTLKDSAFIIYNDSNSLCGINKCGDIAVSRSLTFVSYGFEGFEIVRANSNTIIINKNPESFKLLLSSDLSYIDSGVVQLDFLNVEESDSILFPFECGYIYGVYESSSKKYLCVQMKNISICYWELESVNVGRGFIYKNNFVGIKTKKTKITGTKLY